LAAPDGRAGWAGRSPQGPLRALRPGRRLQRAGGAVVGAAHGNAVAASARGAQAVAPGSGRGSVMWSMPKIGGCPDERTLSRAFSLGAEGALARHLGSCPRCQGQWQALERLQNAGRELPIPPLSAEA